MTAHPHDTPFTQADSDRLLDIIRRELECALLADEIKRRAAEDGLSVGEWIDEELERGMLSPCAAEGCDEEDFATYCEAHGFTCEGCGKDLPNEDRSGCPYQRLCVACNEDPCRCGGCNEDAMHDARERYEEMRRDDW